MNDDEIATMVREQRDKVHSPTPLEQIISRGRVVRGRRRACGVAGGLSVATASALAVTVLGAPVHQHADGTVREVAYKVAAVAAAARPVRAGQWVYWQRAIVASREPGYSSEALLPVWMTADPTRAAYLSHGKLVYMRTPSDEGSDQFGGPPDIPADPNQKDPESGFAVGTGFSYAQLGRLPRDPRALIDYLSSEHRRPAVLVPAAERVFGGIERLLSSYVMPPQLTAELYQALGDLPGVSIDRHMTDGVGRPAIAFVFRWRGGPWTGSAILVSRHGYQLLGTEQIGLSRGFQQELILRRALVSGPGVYPRTR